MFDDKASTAKKRTQRDNETSLTYDNNFLLTP